MNKRWKKLVKGDRLVLILLAVVLASMTIYLYLRLPKIDLWAHEASMPESTKVAQLDSLVASPSREQATNLPKDSTQQHVPPQQAEEQAVIRTDRYPGAPTRQKYIPKLQAGATIDLNSADTLLLQRVPGIGPAFARRIARYRERLGGYYVVEQLQEVYGMDRERYLQIAPFMKIRSAVSPIYLSPDSISRHPYLQYRHTNLLRDHLQRGETLSWPLLMQSGIFTHDDSLRLSPYLQFP